MNDHRDKKKRKKKKEIERKKLSALRGGRGRGKFFRDATSAHFETRAAWLEFSKSGLPAA